jgi:hypothetical protein
MVLAEGFRDLVEAIFFRTPQYAEVTRFARLCQGGTAEMRDTCMTVSYAALCCRRQCDVRSWTARNPGSSSVLFVDVTEMR